MQLFYTFDRDGNVLDGPFCLSAAQAVCDMDPDVVYVDTLDEELTDASVDALFA